MATYLMLHSPRNGPALGTGRGLFRGVLREFDQAMEKRD